MDKYDLDQYTLDRNRSKDIPDFPQEEVEKMLARQDDRIEELKNAIRIENAILFFVACVAICALIWFFVEVL